jgi:hypothetical protein
MEQPVAHQRDFAIVDDGIVGMLLDLSFNRKGGDL